jgi:hypothetical protein
MRGALPRIVLAAMTWTFTVADEWQALAAALEPAAQ